MKILYLVHQFYPEYRTGTEKFVFNLARMTQKAGKKTKIVTYSFYKNSEYEGRIGEVFTREFVYRGLEVLALRHVKPRYDLHISLEDAKTAEIGKELILMERPDIVHVGHPMRITELIGAAKSQEIPYLVTLTDFFLICPRVNLTPSRGALCDGPKEGRNCRDLCPEIPESVIRRRLKRGKEILEAARRVVAPSRFVGRIFMGEYKNLEVKTINHGLSYRRISKNMRTYKKGSFITACYAGSLNAHKGIHVLLDAFKKTQRENIRLRIYGWGPDKRYVEMLREAAKGDKRIQFCGTFSEEEAAGVYKDIDLMIVPSVCYETYSMVLHEALACNIPVIASNAGSMAEAIVHGENGFLFELGNSNRLREIIEMIAADPEILNNMKMNIDRQYVPSVEQEALSYEKLYGDVTRAI